MLLSQEDHHICADEWGGGIRVINSGRHSASGAGWAESPPSVPLKAPPPASPDKHVTAFIDTRHGSEGDIKARSVLDDAQQEQLLNGFPRPVAIIDTKGWPVSANAEFGRITGLGNGSLKIKHISTAFRDVTEDYLCGVRREIAQSKENLPVVKRDANLVDCRGGIYCAHVAFCRVSLSSVLIMMTLVEWFDALPLVESRIRALRFSAVDRKILELLAAGCSNGHIATELHLSRQGLDYRIKSLRDRLDVRSRSALVSKAFTEGLFTLDTWPPRMIE
ncbi:hypothetical protein DV517_65030 [Streptomyces sp. S816]|nr:hypothetical protein DV517_65030 [Streptomyces sp. S816]